MAINAADEAYKLAIDEARLEKGRLNQQRQEEIDRYQAWEHAANEAHVAIAKKRTPAQTNEKEGNETDAEASQHVNKQKDDLQKHQHGVVSNLVMLNIFLRTQKYWNKLRR